MELDRLKQQITAQLGRIVPSLVKYKYALIVLLVGILLLYAGGGVRDKPQMPQRQTEEASNFELTAFEERLESKLAQIAGVGRVELMLSLEQSSESVYASNIRQAEHGGENNGSYESTLSTVSDGSYGEQPVRIKENCPTFRGAVVLCDGAQDSNVRLAVTQAVRAVCGLSTDRISVIQMEQ